ncbi:MAG: GspE/PulE family protein [bacterium]
MDEETEGLDTEDVAEGPTDLPEPLQTLLLQASYDRATDVHLDPVEEGLAIRFRVDGMIHVKETVSESTGHRLQNQIRVAAGLDTEALFVPTEAQIRWSEGEEERDVRVVVGPTGTGEATHLRLLYAAEKLRHVETLGMSEDDLGKVLSTIKVPAGLLVVGGQTGTGKTTTLYSIVSALDLDTTIAVSVEDPVEFEVPGLRQFSVDREHGLTIFEGLRVILRMDPDVILVGEIRDQQSAITAARAALAGRLVLATTHAVDAATAVQALHYLSVPYHIIGGCLRLVVAQNLIRRVCSQCAGARPLRDEERKLFDQAGIEPPDEVAEAVGCEECSQYGYMGRTGVFETAVVDSAIADAITAGTVLDELRQRFRDEGVRSMLHDALSKVAEGVTTMEEVYQFYWPGRGMAG